MIRILIFLALIFALGLGFAWLADRPGDLVVTFGGYRYAVSLMVAASAITAIVAAVMILWWLTKAIWNSPHAIARYFRVRRRDRGYQALSTGMIAAGAGDYDLARRMNKQAVKLIRSDQEPLIHLLDAQASLLEGDHDSARAKFQAMIDDPETRLLGLRGLYIEAERLGDRAAARHYAARAADVAPQLVWASESTLEEKSERGDWDGALKLVDARKPSRPAEKEFAARRRAVLLTAKSISLIDTDPAGARAAGIEANRLRPDFVPAALAAARALLKLGEIRKGARILEASWNLEPHPQVADLYIHARPGDSAHDRLYRARKLEGWRQNNAVSYLAMARAALEAGEFAEARDAAEAALRLDPREGVYLLLADIEEAETGDQGRVREYLSRALRAPRDKAWVADGFVSEKWAPLSPVTGRLDAFEWRAPIERLAQTIEMDDLPRPPALAAPARGSDAELDEFEATEEVELAPEILDVPEAAEPPAPVPQPQPTQPASREPVRPPLAVVAAKPEGAEPVMVKPQRLPDDPGVEPDEGEARRFRLF